MANIGSEWYNYATISVAGTINPIPSGGAFLHTLNITDATAGTITVRNGTATGAATVALIVAGTPNTFRFDELIPLGLSIVTDANIKVNISYASL